MEKAVILKKLNEHGYSAYEASYTEYAGAGYVLGEKGDAKHLIIMGNAPPDFEGEVLEIEGLELFFCPLSHENATQMKKIFSWLKPVSIENRNITIGTGDRLGIVTGAHIEAIKGTGVFPVLAQQSIRELTLTGRTNSSMMDDVMWQVFAAGYQGGYAADGDHLKDIEDIRASIEEGDTMITLDCTEHIPSGKVIGAGELKKLQEEYCVRDFDLKTGRISITPEQLKEIIEVYSEAVDFIEKVYKTLILTCGKEVSLEVSIDETSMSTTPEAHFFVANELRKKEVPFSSLAPKFCGVFQKGIDYIGDQAQFEAELRQHVMIADYFGYRISVHSGSDKFSLFPYIGRGCHGRFHLKTSGTSWVEAVRVIAMCEPDLFRRMLRYSCAHFEEAKKKYHVLGHAENVPDIDKITDAKLPELMDLQDTRQVMHISYGFLLRDRNDKGKYRFRNDIYSALGRNEKLLNEMISEHIKKHLHYLGLC